MASNPPYNIHLPTHWSLARSAEQMSALNKPALPRQNSARMGTDGPPGHPGHYGRELGTQEYVPAGQTCHREIENEFFKPRASNKIEDHPSYPGRYAGEYKPGLRPQPYLTGGQGQERVGSGSNGGQAKQGEAPAQQREAPAQQRKAPAQQKEGGCCVIL